MNEQILARHSRNDLFTTGECEQILERVLAAQGEAKGQLVKFEIVPELDKIGYLGEYFHLYLSYVIDNPDHVQQLRLFVKSMPWHNVNEADFTENSAILQKEAQLYERALNELKRCSKHIWVAECYLTRKDLFVMQNIIDLGYEPLPDTKAYLAEAQMRPVLKGLATLHTCSIAYEVKQEVNLGEKLKDVLFEATVSPTVDWYKAGLRSVFSAIKAHPKYRNHPRIMSESFMEKELPALFDTVYDMVNPSPKYRNVFCHRDVWSGNLFFNKLQPTEVGCVFVDFQLCRYSPPAIDVVQALYLNLKPSVRGACVTQFCQYYYDCFAEEMAAQSLNAEDHISYAEFLESFEEFQLFGALYNTLVATILRVPGDYLSDMKQNRPEDFHRYTDVDRTKEVLELLATDKEFRDCLYECIDELMDIVWSKTTTQCAKSKNIANKLESV